MNYNKRGNNMKVVECKDCKYIYDCEYTYLGGCSDGAGWEEEGDEK